MRPTAALVATAFALTVASVAPPARASDASLDRRTFVTLHVNTVDQGETVVVLRAPDVLIPIEALDAAGIHGFKGNRTTIGGKEYVSLASLEPDITFAFDVDALKLDVTASPKQLASVSKDLARNRPADISYQSARNAYVNYAFTDSTGGFASAFFDGAFNHAQDGLHYSFTAQRAASLRRGLIYYQMDDRATTVRRIVGDVNAQTGDLGAAAYIAGFAVGRDFDLDPYAVHYPLPSLNGVAATPSTADIYVNGVLVQRVDLPPGQFDLNHLPVTTGSANTRVVVTDAFGRAQTYSQNFYTAADLLTPGLTDYQFVAGMLRQDPFASGDRYGPPVVASRYRVGVNDALTVGGRFEATAHGYSGGPTVDFKLPIGAVHVSTAASRQDGLGGGAVSMGYGYAASTFAFSLSMLSQGPYYASIGQAPYVDRATSAVTAGVSWQYRHANELALQYSRRHDRDSGISDVLSLDDSVPFARGITLVIGAERDRATGGAPSFALTATFNVTLGRRATASVTERSGNTNGASIDVSGTPGTTYGFGYAAAYDSSFQHAFNATVAERSRYGDLQFDLANLQGSPSSQTLRASGGVVAVDGGLYATRAVTSAFALVDVPNLSGVPVYVENQYAGKTDARGRLIVPDLLPNFGNDLRIDDKNVPVNTDIQSLQKLIAPPELSGAVVTFAAPQVHAIRGRVVVGAHGAQVIPKYGELTLAVAGVARGDSALGENGEFYLEDVPAATYDATVDYADGACHFTFAVPNDPAAMTDVGTLTCGQ